jgi:hypothetical protein
MFGWNPPNIVSTKLVPVDFQESVDETVYTLTIPGILEEKGVMKRPPTFGLSERRFQSSH